MCGVRPCVPHLQREHLLNDHAMPVLAACDPGWTGAHCVLCDPANTTACAAVYAGSMCAVESPEEAFNATTVLKGYDDCSIVESTLEGMTLDQASLYGRCGTNLTGLEGAWACRLFFSATSPAADLKVELTGCTRPTDPPADGDLVVDCATVSPSCTSGCDPTTPPGAAPWLFFRPPHLLLSWGCAHLL